MVKRQIKRNPGTRFRSQKWLYQLCDGGPVAYPPWLCFPASRGVEHSQSVWAAGGLRNRRRGRIKKWEEEEEETKSE